MPRTYEETGLVRAHARSVRSSSQKARTVLTHIRGKSVGEAQAILRYSTRGVARDIELVLRSAVSNAVQNHGLEVEQLVVHQAFADEGLTMKRGKARARGRYMRVRKRTCHLTILLSAAADAAELKRMDKEASAPEPAAETPAEQQPRRSRAKKAETAEEPEATAEVAEKAPAREPETTADEAEPDPTSHASVDDEPASEPDEKEA